MISNQKHCQMAENSSSALVWLRDLNVPSTTLNAVFSAVITFLKQNCTLTDETKLCNVIVPNHRISKGIWISMQYDGTENWNRITSDVAISLCEKSAYIYVGAM